MKIGGNNEFWMIAGPLLGVVLVITFVMGPDEFVRTAERLTTESWEVVVRTFRR
jgi:hypothetical protein